MDHLPSQGFTNEILIYNIKCKLCALCVYVVKMGRSDLQFLRGKTKKSRSITPAFPILSLFLQFKLDPLCQWKAVGVVDRIGLTAHVYFPCI
jgi:hypothetical protein